jgi:hypothetical protein
MNNAGSNPDDRRNAINEPGTPPPASPPDPDTSHSTGGVDHHSRGPLTVGDEAARHPGELTADESPGAGAYDGWDDDDLPTDAGPSGEEPEMIATAPDARASVEEWHIRSVGHRPTDFMARDCLFGSLFRDHRVPWFRRYVKKPSTWMKSLVGHLENETDRGQALRYVVLHFLHKLHLSRLMGFLNEQEQTYGPLDPYPARTLGRLWNCTPYGVEVVRVGAGGRPSPGCNLSRLCPWCHARKVAQLDQVISEGPLSRGGTRYLFLGKARPFPERMGGVDGTYREVDWDDYARGGKVRGHWGRYFGRDRARLAHTRRVLAASLMEQASLIGLRDGIWTHQLGSAQLENGQRTFLHDVAMISGVDTDWIDRTPTDEDGTIFWGGIEHSALPDIDAALEVLWLPLPLDRPGALRVALAGSSVGYAVSKLDLPPEWFGTPDEHRSGIPGALSWQPTMPFDDQIWFAYAEAVKNQPLYRPFGTWRKSMAAVAADLRSSIDRKFKVAQAKRFAQDRQQRGNRRRGREANDRRAELLEVALPLWPVVLAEPPTGRGRPGHRRRLAQLLVEQGTFPSRRDLDWLMKRLSSP